jgi:cytochrome c-type biogenesis protein CcmE
MKLGAILAIVLSGVGLTVVVTAFLTNASPYVSASEAKSMRGNNLHVPGDLLKETVKVSAASQQVRFKMRGDDGNILDVVYNGIPPANMGTATRLVAVGGMKNGVFEAENLLLKCPSKYEGEIQVDKIKPASSQGAERAYGESTVSLTGKAEVIRQ